MLNLKKLVILTTYLLGLFGNSNSYIFDTCTSQSSVSDSKVVQTLNGPIRGQCYSVPVTFSNNSKIAYDVFTWLSIPYARPPIKANRFLKPQPVENWNETRDAFSWPKFCPQDNSSIGVSDLSDVSEDCLYLNILTLGDSFINRKSILKPILIYIHGGGFLNGGTALDLLEPSTLVAVSDIIVVTVQYRLGVFGFLYHDGIDGSGNAGFLDQNLAIKWVYDNAVLFGGDKSKITISGESAGAWSVGFHLFYPPSWPYFRNAILESGGPTGENNFYALFTSAVAINKTEQFFGQLNCNKGSTEDNFKCIQNLPLSALIEQAYKPPDRQFDRLVLDNVVFNSTIDNLIKDNEFKPCNVITGYEADEFGFFIPGILSSLNLTEQYAKNMNKELFLKLIINLANYEVTPSVIDNLLLAYLDTDQKKLNLTSEEYLYYFIQIQSDLIFNCQSFQLAEIYTNRGHQAYVYKHDYRLTTSPISAIYGVTHTENIPFVFAEALSNKKPPLITANPYSASAYNYSFEVKQFSEELIHYYSNFIKHDDPNYSDSSSGDFEYWSPLYTDKNFESLSAVEKMDRGSYLWMQKNNFSMQIGFANHKCDFWNYTFDGSNLANNSVLNLNYIFILIMINILSYVFF